MTWQSAWEEGRTPWDAGASAPVLRALVEAGSLPQGRTFVPGAGSGYDLLTLACEQRSVVGLDLAPLAKTRFEALAQAHPHRDQVEFVVEDAFAYVPEAPFELVWDYTFLCALRAELRPAWAKMMDRLLHPDRGQLAALIFPVVPDADPTEGPPYPMTPELVTQLVEPFLEPISIVPVETSHPGREGKEWLGRFGRRS
ncbi:MAG: methyltransferase domain-containing protein [Nannocystaceae bacterium]|nr:methyltransferase domain-containing protein [Nannocystaceae bacterium]